MTTNSQPLVVGLLRGLSVLRCFDHGREILGSSEIARITGLPQPTVWRLCKTLEHAGYLVTTDGGTRFRPGLSILTLGYAALDSLEIAELARPFLSEIAARFNGAASLSTREGVSMLYVERCEAKGTVLHINLRVGSEVPIIRTGTGWGYLAGRKPAERQAILAQCKSADPEDYQRFSDPMQAALEQYPAVGYVENVGVFFPGLTTVAVPLVSETVQTDYVLNCTSPADALSTPALRAEAGEALKMLAERLRPAILRRN
ncbi:hypothetical protein G6F65_018346 [Rhizopus arrhizus]|nr:hypothetical protein G6F65_018346 [Rhizopus arrhizus]